MIFLQRWSNLRTSFFVGNSNLLKSKFHFWSFNGLIGCFPKMNFSWCHILTESFDFNKMNISNKIRNSLSSSSSLVLLCMVKPQHSSLRGGKELMHVDSPSPFLFEILHIPWVCPRQGGAEIFFFYGVHINYWQFFAAVVSLFNHNTCSDLSCCQNALQT